MCWFRHLQANLSEARVGLIVPISFGDQPSTGTDRWRLLYRSLPVGEHHQYFPLFIAPNYFDESIGTHVRLFGVLANC